MLRQPRESESASSAVESMDAQTEGGVEENAGSRRQFLQLGAFTAIGLASGCGTSPPGEPGGDSGTGGGTSQGTGGTGTGGTGTGGSAVGTGGTSGTGGTTPMTTGGTGPGAGGVSGTSGTGAAGGGNAAGMNAGTGGANATGGAPAGGAGNGAGGASATGGAPAGGMGGSPMGGAGGGGGGTGDGWKENNYTPLPMLPDGTHGPSLPKLPDPFKFLDGSRISSKSDWERLRADLSAKIQAAVYGPKMPPPDKLTATLSGSTVTVNLTVGSKTGMFTFSIKGGGSMGSPKPAVIRCASSGCPFPSSVATIDFDEHAFAQENKSIPTSGLVSTLFGSAAAKSGSDICWAWGASRIIDALEMLPEAGIDTKALATTGCSFAGKGALAMGAFDERVALTVMQEGGSGGCAAWRLSTAETKAGQKIQEATEIVGEQNWEGADFRALFSGKSAASAPVDMLIADQHFVVAICAPRAVLLIENDIDWLGPVATYGGGVSGREVFKALGIEDRVGISVAANHGHCQFPSSQQKDLTNFINRFLLKMTADTSGVDLLNATNSKLKTFNKADWIDWDTPTLGGSLPWDPFA